MLAAPPVVTTRIFARVPDALLVQGRTNFFTRVLGAPVGAFLEGPAFDREGNLYCVDVAYGRIFRIDPSGRFDVLVEYDGQPNGIQIHKDGKLYVADRLRGIVAIDPATRDIEFLIHGWNLERFLGPNDLAFTPNGDIYFTDQGMSDFTNPVGRVYRLGRDGELDQVLSGLNSPNGIVVDPTGRFLFVALTRANMIIKGMILPDGSLTRVGTYLHLNGGAGPDGLAMGAGGELVVAHPGIGIWGFDARGQPICRVDLCEGSHGTNIAFGRTDCRRLCDRVRGRNHPGRGALPVERRAPLPCRLNRLRAQRKSRAHRREGQWRRRPCPGSGGGSSRSRSRSSSSRRSIAATSRSPR